MAGLNDKGKLAIASAGIFGMTGILMLIAFNLYGLWFPPWVVSAMFALAAALIAHQLLGGLTASRFSTGRVQLAGGMAALAFIWFVGDRSLTTQLKPNDSLQARKGVLVELERQREVIELDVEHAKQKLHRLKQQADSTNQENSPSPSEGRLSIDKLVAALDPESSEAIRIRQMVTRRTGPWERTSRQADYTLSVAGNQRGRVASACDEVKFAGETTELTSLLIKGDDSFGSDEGVRVDRWKPLNPSVCDRFQIQVSCEIARDIFTERVVNCDENGGFTWELGFGGLIPVRAAIVVD